MAKSSTSEASAILSKYETFLFDCDGVIWCGKEKIEGIDVAIKTLQDLGKRIFFVSNNSTKDRTLYVEKLAKMGITGVTEDQIFHSGYATAQYCKTHHAGKDVYVLGEPAFKKELANVSGVSVVLEEESSYYDPDAEAAKELPDVSAVIVGMDFSFSMKKLARAIIYLDAKTRPEFILTNPDAVIPINGKSLPEAASIAAAITANNGLHPDVICGKPSELLFSIICSACPQVEASTTLMIGDRLDTDIRFGVKSNIDTLLVLCGYEKIDNVKKSDVTPTYIFDSVPAFVEQGKQ